MKYKGAIFDLDGVLVDTAKYHFLAWKELADILSIPFTEQDNELLKGVSRMDSLNILLSIGNKEYSTWEKERMARKKNKLYVSFINKMDSSEILPDVEETLEVLRNRGVKVSLGSASKNSPKILKNTGLFKYFDAIVDGNDLSKAKPDPEVFLLGAHRLNLDTKSCVVFEDAQAGCKAAKAAGMYAVGIGLKENLSSADEVVNSFKEFEADSLF